jgi:carbamoyl-phosphate synthase large subunit
MNVLLTCAGRRNYLLEYFREALKGEGLVLAADATPEAPALQEADRSFVVPPVHDPGYIPTILSICVDHQVGLLLSLNDLELPLLARERERFRAQGTLVVVSSPEVIDLCFDKAKTVAFLSRVRVQTARTYLTLEEAERALIAGAESFPLVVKPRWGTASIGIEIAEDVHELTHAFWLLRAKLRRTILAPASANDPERSVLIQQKLIGVEYGLNVVNDLEGQTVACFAERKLAMHGGETDRATTANLPELNRIGTTIGSALGHIGNLDCDVFVNEGAYYVLEMNPRFGGHYPFAHVAGVNVPAALIAWAQGEKPSRSWLQMRADVTAAKCSRLVMYRKGAQQPGR